MPAITSRLPAPLSERIASATQNIYNRQGREVDVAIGGIPFRLATSSELPHSVETIQVRKEQVDTEADPGEQSLAGWWRRAQASWHEGAGFTYQESSEQLTPGNGFRDSRGVDVFTKGRITLLKKMELNEAGVFSKVRPATGAEGEVATAIRSGNLVSFTAVDAAWQLLQAAVVGPLLDGMASGPNFYSVEDTTLYAGQVSDPDLALSWPLASNGGANLVWGKHRLWVYGDNVLYQPDLSDPSGTSQTPIFTHPSPGFAYTSACEGPGAMYFAGGDGHTSSIQAITLDSTGGLPTLSGATVVATLPDGESITAIASLGGVFIGIGTSLGFRVGRINSDASLTYGPLLFEEPVHHVTTQGRFFLACLSNATTPIAYRVDTGTELDELVYPYAPDIEASTGTTFTSIAAIGTRLLATVANAGVAASLWYQSATNYVDEGWIESGRIRFRTTERKVFRSLQVEIEPLDGSMVIDLIREGGSTQRVGQITVQDVIREDPFPIGGQSLRYGSVRFTLVPDDAGTAAPVLNAFQLTAHPSVRPQRLITLPLLCFDKERAHSGQMYGGTGFALDRVTALQTIEDQGELVTYQDFTMGDSGQLVLIERIRFVQTSPASNPTSGTGPGGVLVVELKTVEGT